MLVSLVPSASVPCNVKVIAISSVKGYSKEE